MTVPSRTITQPMRGFGAVMYMPLAAHSRARAMPSVSLSICTVFSVPVATPGLWWRGGAVAGRVAPRVAAARAAQHIDFNTADAAALEQRQRAIARRRRIAVAATAPGAI